MKNKKTKILLVLMAVLILALTGCGSTDGKRIVRIGHNQSTSHPSHLGLVAFQEFINENWVTNMW